MMSPNILNSIENIYNSECIVSKQDATDRSIVKKEETRSVTRHNFLSFNGVQVT